VLWKNGVPETLGIGRDYYSMQASHLAVSDSGVVYVAGTVRYSYYSSKRYIVLWADGSPHIFDYAPNDTYSYVYGLAASGDDVYIAASGGYPKALIWKNGTPTYLTTTNRSYFSITSIFASGEDLYTTEIDFNRVWKNNEILTQTPHPACSIFVSGGDVYMSWDGEAEFVGYWKNGKAHILGEYGSWGRGTTRLFVSDEDVYLLGKDKHEIFYWKNGRRHGPLVSNRYSECKSIAVSGDDVYVVADVEGRGRLWKNGVEQALKPANPVW
jgi:hypothetical protein